MSGAEPADDVAAIDIGAEPEAVWDLVADVTQMGRWSPECYRCRGSTVVPVLGTEPASRAGTR